MIMQVIQVLGVLVVSYLLGSIPFGWIIVKLSTGRDIREVESGRMGGTNAMRAAGFLAGLLTAIGDIAKAYVTHWLVVWFIPANWGIRIWLEVAAPLMAILGHNYSIYLLTRHSDGTVKLRGGAGGAPCFGGTLGILPWSAYIILPIGVLVYVFVGYASVTTLSIAISATALFTYLALTQGYPWQYILYGVFSFFILAWALRPNLKRLAEGTERAVGLRAYLQKRRQAQSK